MKGISLKSLRSKIILGFIIPILLICLSSLILYQSIKLSLDNADWVRHTQEVIAEASVLEKLMIDMETGLRGFLLMKREHFLEPYFEGKGRWYVEIEALKKLVSDNPHQVEKAEEIETFANNWIELHAKPEIERVRTQVLNKGVTFDAQNVNEEVGKKRMDEIREKIGAFIQKEEHLMEMRTAKANKTAGYLIVLSAFGLPLITIVGVFITVSILFRSILVPIKRLVLVTKQVEGGSLDVSIEHYAKDEIGELANAFNQMIRSIKQYHKSLEVNNRELSETQEKLEHKLQELEQLSNYKSQFLANMSHELRTPLNGIIGMLRLMQNNNRPERQAQYIDIASKSSQSLLDMINDVLDISRSESGKLVVESIEFEVQSLIRGFLRLHRTQISRKRC